jgi:hypothetical protein
MSSTRVCSKNCSMCLTFGRTVTFGRLLKRFGSVDAALGASVSGLMKVEGIGTPRPNESLQVEINSTLALSWSWPASTVRR